MRNNSLRTWRKPWTWSTRTWLIAITIATIASPFLLRSLYLWQIPDVVLPFAIDDVIQPDVPDEENSFIAYATVFERISNPKFNKPSATNTKIAVGDDLTIEELRGLISNYDEQALADYIRAGAMPLGGGPSLKTTTYWYNLTFQQYFRQLVRHFGPLAISLEEGGEFEKSWACHRANLQASIHVEQPPLLISVLIGVAIRITSANGMVHWATNSSISSAQLRSARFDLEREYARRAPHSAALKAELIVVSNSMKDLQLLDYVLPNPSGIAETDLIRNLKRVPLWITGQPELSLRTYRQLLLNNLTEIDKPLNLRRPSTAYGGMLVFQLDPNIIRVPGQLSAERLEQIVRGNGPLELPMSRLSISLIPAIANFDQAYQRDDARYQCLRVIFAINEFQRNYGDFPEELGQLVPEVLDAIPIDPMDPAGGLLRYRREDNGECTVWSVGPNGIDDNAMLYAEEVLDIGFNAKLHGAEQSKAGSSPNP